jgi:hypothetical protein
MCKDVLTSERIQQVATCVHRCLGTICQNAQELPSTHRSTEGRTESGKQTCDISFSCAVWILLFIIHHFTHVMQLLWQLK